MNKNQVRHLGAKEGDYNVAFYGADKIVRRLRGCLKFDIENAVAWYPELPKLQWSNSNCGKMQCGSNQGYIGNYCGYCNHFQR